MSILHSVGTSLLGLPSTSQESFSVNYSTLTFKGESAEYEKAYEDDYFIKSLNPFRFSLVLSMLFYGAFAVLDAIVVPELKSIFWFIRFGVVFPVLVAVFIFTYSRLFKEIYAVCDCLIMFITGFGIIVMIIFAARIGNYNYYAGLMLIFIFGYTFIRARFLYALIAGWSIVISYEISAIWLSHTPFITLVNNNYFFIGANIIGMFISYFLELSTRKEFYMRILLEQEKENVKTANNALEKRVADRTQQLSDTNQDLKKEIEIQAEI